MTKKGYFAMYLLFGFLISCRQVVLQQEVDAETPPAAVTQSLAPVSWVELRNSTESQEFNYQIDATWPNLTGPQAIAAPFNEHINRLVQAVQDDFIAALEARENKKVGGEYFPLSELTLDYDLTYTSEELYSLYLTTTQYIAISAHPNTFSYAINYDVKQGHLLTLADLFLDDVDPVTALQDRVTDELTARGFDIDRGVVEDLMQSREHWNVLTEGLRINFDAYQVAPGAAGPQLVLIPWGDLSEVLDGDSPFGSISPRQLKNQSWTVVLSAVQQGYD